MKPLRTLLAATLVFMALGAAAATQISGVTVEENMDLKGNPLVLNGAGVRYKAVFKVYVAALYLGKKTGTPEEVLALPGAKHMAVTMLTVRPRARQRPSWCWRMACTVSLASAGESSRRLKRYRASA